MQRLQYPIWRGRLFPAIYAYALAAIRKAKAIITAAAIHETIAQKKELSSTPYAEVTMTTPYHKKQSYQFKIYATMPNEPMRYQATQYTKKIKTANPMHRPTWPKPPNLQHCAPHTDEHTPIAQIQHHPAIESRRRTHSISANPDHTPQMLPPTKSTPPIHCAAPPGQRCKYRQPRTSRHQTHTKCADPMPPQPFEATNPCTPSQPTLIP